MLPQIKILLGDRQRRKLLLLLAGMVFAAALEMVGIGTIPVFVALLTEPARILKALPDSTLTSLIQKTDLATLTLVGAGLLAFVFLIKNLYLAGLIYAESRILRDIVNAISNRLFRAYLYSPYTFHLQRNPAQLVRNISIETEATRTVIRAYLLILREGLVLVVVFILLLLMDPLVSLSVFVLLGIAATAFYLVVRRSLSHRGELAQAHRGRLVQIINQSMGAIKDAKILGREPYLMDLFSTEMYGKELHEAYQVVVTALPRLFLEVVSLTAVLLVASVFVLLNRPMQSLLPVLALLAIAMVRMVPAFNAISSSLGKIRYNLASLNLISSEFQSLEISTGKNHFGSTADVRDTGISKLNATIRLSNIHYNYPNTSSQALNGVSLAIRAGEAVGFIGTSGAGKSTLVDVILGLLTPTKGEVRVDGSDIQKNLAAWQRQIGYIAQDIYLLDDSICRNIAFGLADDQIDEIALSSAIRAAQLDAFVATLPDGLNTQVGNRGIRLSGGQRQRIGIARALYHDPRVLVMDEATSALDNETEREVIEAIGRLRGDRTLITIAHRLTTVIDCDRLYLLEDGQVKDQGSYEELARRHEHLRLIER